MALYKFCIVLYCISPALASPVANKRCCLVISSSHRQTRPDPTRQFCRVGSFGMNRSASSPDCRLQTVSGADPSPQKNLQFLPSPNGCQIVCCMYRFRQRRKSAAAGAYDSERSVRVGDAAFFKSLWTLVANSGYTADGVTACI